MRGHETSDQEDHASSKSTTSSTCCRIGRCGCFGLFRRLLLCRFRCAIEQIAVSANENLSVNNDISVSLSITFYEKQIEK